MSRAAEPSIKATTTTLADRKEVLDYQRALKMARSVHAYVRGNTAKFYEWLEESPYVKSVPSGPDVWICGDCHLGNLGPLADVDRHVDIQVRDLDQTVIGNPALDLIRLGLSLETAARSSDLRGMITVAMMGAMMRGYREAIVPADGPAVREPPLVRTARKRALGRKWRHLAKERIDGESPNIPLGRHFWPLEEKERAAIDALFEQSEIHDRVLALAGYRAGGKIKVKDVAYWQKGCSSLGNLRYAVLLAVRETGSKRDYYALVDIKEAVASVAPSAANAEMPKDFADRVVAGAQAMAPNLGDRMIAAHLLKKPVVLRELAPQDLKIEIGQFSGAEAMEAARYLGHVVGLAHAGQMSLAGRKKWAGRIGVADDSAAPDWLWDNIVHLAGAHEAGYLAHCRTLSERPVPDFCGAAS